MSVQRISILLLSAPLWRLTNLNWKLPRVSICLVPSMTSRWLIWKSTTLLTDAERFVSITPLYTPTSSGEADNIFITRSYDATSHFETVVEDVQDVWKRVVGSDLVLKKREVE